MNLRRRKRHSALLLLVGLFPFAHGVGTARGQVVENASHRDDHAGHVHTLAPTEVDATPPKATGERAAFDRVAPVLASYSVAIMAAALFGGWLPHRFRMSHTQFQVLLSLVAGLMLGVALFHLLPHAIQEVGLAGVTSVTYWMTFGVLLTFFMLRILHFHHHEPGDSAAHAHDHDHDHDGADDTLDPCSVSHATGPGDFRWIGIFVGLAMHTLLDGVALGAAIQAEAEHATGAALFGFGIFLAIALHKPIDSLSITSLMIAGGWSTRAKVLVNLLFASLCPLGAAAFIGGAMSFSESMHRVVSAGLAFSAGVFLCVSLADLLPEMQFHSHHRLRLTIALLTGAGMAWAIQFLEPAHLHQ